MRLGVAPSVGVKFYQVCVNNMAYLVIVEVFTRFFGDKLKRVLNGSISGKSLLV